MTPGPLQGATLAALYANTTVNDHAMPWQAPHSFHRRTQPKFTCLLGGVGGYIGLQAANTKKFSDYYSLAMGLSAPEKSAECVSYISGISVDVRKLAKTDQQKKQAADIFYAQGNAYFEQEQYPDAITAYETALEYNAHKEEIKRDLAISYARGGNLGRAEALAKELPSGSASATLLQGEIDFAKGQYDEAVKAFKSRAHARACA